jgi:hypothetical protein
MRTFSARDAVTTPKFVQVQTLRDAKYAEFESAADAASGIPYERIAADIVDLGKTSAVTDPLGRPCGGLTVIEIDEDNRALVRPWLDPSLLGLKILGDAAALEIANFVGVGGRHVAYWCRAPYDLRFPAKLLKSLGFAPCPTAPNLGEQQAKLLQGDDPWWRLDPRAIPNAIARALALTEGPSPRRSETGLVVDIFYDHWLLKPEQERFRQEIARYGRTMGAG